MCSPPRLAVQTHLRSPQQDALPFTPFPPKSPLSLPDVCCWDETCSCSCHLYASTDRREKGWQFVLYHMPRGNKALVIRPEFGPLPRALSLSFSLFFKIDLILFFLACAHILGRNLKENHCLALTRRGLLSVPSQRGNHFDHYLCNISDRTHYRSVEATDSYNILSPAHVRSAAVRKF